MENTAPSSDAQAILAVLKEVSWDWASMEQAVPATIAGAVLREAANRLARYSETESGQDQWLIDQDELLAVADEIDPR